MVANLVHCANATTQPIFLSPFRPVVLSFTMYAKWRVANPSILTERQCDNTPQDNAPFGVHRLQVTGRQDESPKMRRLEVCPVVTSAITTQKSVPDQSP
jgi:hypothetical protein